MIVAVLSDIHDHIWNLSKTIQFLKDKNCETVLALGDYCAPFTVAHLASLDLPIYGVFGNNDGDQVQLLSSANGKIKFFPLNQEYGEVEIDHKKIAFTHYPKLGQLLAHSARYDAVFYGHTHLKNLEFEDKTILSNPGSICGIISGKSAQASFIIYDTKTHQVEFVDLS